MVYHGVGQSISAYHDGVYMGDQNFRKNSAQIGTLVRGNGQVVIGKRQHPTFALHSTADVDKVKMYNRQLSAQEIENMY